MDRSGLDLDNSNLMRDDPPAARPARLPRHAPARRLPAYALYGEAQGPGDVLHVESIAARSRLHDWEIGPHRHEALFQMLVIRRGTVVAWLDNEDRPLAGPCALTVPAMTAHGFRFSPSVDGWVFTLVESHLRALVEGDAGWRQALLCLRAWPLQAGAVAAVVAAASALQSDYAGHDRWRTQAVDTALRRLLLELVRSAPEPATAAGSAAPRALAHVQRLRTLVEARFRQQPTLAALAQEIGITPTQLNRVCHQVLGHSALGVQHARLLLEAQRDLAYTSMSIKQIALDLGFSDAAYFARFFQRLAGCTPSAWRSARGAR
jgi:AraC family transcriptional activator of pobA